MGSINSTQTLRNGKGSGQVRSGQVRSGQVILFHLGNCRDRHSAAPMKLNDFWPKEDRLGGRLSWEDEAEWVL